MHPIMITGIILLTGFILGEIAEKLNLPKITGYILAGIILNPGFSGFIPSDFTDNTQLITNISIAFITFSVGGTLLFSEIKKQGKNILYITICEAQFSFLLVAGGFMLITPFFMNSSSSGWINTFIPASLLIAALASPTDPSATLAVEHEYKAKGPVSSTILGVSAFDDGLGIINYSIAICLGGALIAGEALNFGTLFFRPAAIITGGILCGIAFGLIFNFITRLMAKDTEGTFIVVIFGLISLCFGFAELLKVDPLLASMSMGAIVVNFNPSRQKIFSMLERYTEELIFVLFFTLSGMHLQLDMFIKSFLLVLFFFILRSVGKITGTVVGGAISGAPSNIRKFTAGGLIPQGGIVVGLALMIKQNPVFSGIADIVINLIIGATVLHEILGPLISKTALTMAGEIKSSHPKGVKS